MAFPVAGWFAHKKLRQLSDDIGPRPKRPSKPLPRRKDLSGDLREALSRLTFYGAFTPTAFMLFSIFRRTRQKEWWQDVEPLPEARRSGPWDTPETISDEIVDIVDIDYDFREATARNREHMPEKD
ncbi:MAG: hypothetical protein EP336_10760 [Rhodobacteraceae bacterium]|nr:MAG: hypothetical protein EP336_10760 [Paracoccaceae bacterium]